MKKVRPNMGCSIVILLGFIGYLMNFQNLWQYWPAGGMLANATVEWFLSVIGVFVPLIGVVTGWIW